MSPWYFFLSHAFIFLWFSIPNCHFFFLAKWQNLIKPLIIVSKWNESGNKNQNTVHRIQRWWNCWTPWHRPLASTIDRGSQANKKCSHYEDPIINIFSWLVTSGCSGQWNLIKVHFGEHCEINKLWDYACTTDTGSRWLNIRITWFCLWVWWGFLAIILWWNRADVIAV